MRFSVHTRLPSICLGSPQWKSRPRRRCATGSILYRSKTLIAADGLDHARHRTRLVQSAAHLLEYDVGIFLLRLDQGLADYLHHFVAAGLELGEQLGRGMRGRLLEVVHQDDALAALFELLHHRGNDLLRLAHLE